VYEDRAHHPFHHRVRARLWVHDEGPASDPDCRCTGTGCCGVDTLYLINQSVCCGGKLYVNATTSCCGGSRPYNYSTEGCCGSTVYDLQKEYCCNYRVVTGNCNEGNGSISS